MANSWHVRQRQASTMDVIIMSLSKAPTNCHRALWLQRQRAPDKKDVGPSKEPHDPFYKTPYSLLGFSGTKVLKRQANIMKHGKPVQNQHRRLAGRGMPWVGIAQFLIKDTP